MMTVMAKATEVSAKATRRRFSTSEKVRILDEADACTEKGSLSALMRREGIYSSHLSTWRAQRATGQFSTSPRKRGPVSVAADPKDKQILELDRLEGHPRFYQRTPIVLADGTMVQAYLLTPEKVARRPVIESGDWRTRRQRTARELHRGPSRCRG